MSAAERAPNPVLHGSCLCRAVRFTVTGPPKTTYLCHCLDCRKQTGSLFATQLFYEEAAFAVAPGVDAGAGGKVHRFSFVAREHEDPTTAPAPNLAWCGRCGSPLWVDTTQGIIVRYGAIDCENDEDAMNLLQGLTASKTDNGTPMFQPEFEYFCKRKASWAQGWAVDGAAQRQEKKA